MTYPTRKNDSSNHRKRRSVNNNNNNNRVSLSSSLSSVPVNNNNTVNDDIVEQLRKQRLKMATTSSSSSTSTSTSNDIFELESNNVIEEEEEEEELQRMNQKLPSPPPPPPVLGNYTYDISRGAYFPTTRNNDSTNYNISTAKRLTTTTTTKDTVNNNDTTKRKSTSIIHQIQQQKQLSPPVITYLTNVIAGQGSSCSNNKQFVLPYGQIRRNLLATCASKVIYNSLSIVPADYQYVDMYHSFWTPESPCVRSSRNSTLPLEQQQNDIEVELQQGGGNVPLWCRTFDILPTKYQDNIPAEFFSTTAPNEFIPTTPFAKFVRVPPGQPYYYHCKRILYPIPTDDDPNQQQQQQQRIVQPVIGMFDKNIRKNSRVYKTALYMMQYNMELIFESGKHSPIDANDFAVLRNHPQRIYFGGNNNGIYVYNHNYNNNNNNTRHGHYDQITTINKPKIGQSDIFCVETDPSGLYHPNMILFGRRDGQILVHDSRSDVQSIPIGTLSNNNNNNNSNNNNTTKSLQHNVDRQSVYQIEPLFHNRPDQILARCRTSWCLYDVRKMSTMKDQTNNNNNNTAVIHSVSFDGTVGSNPCKGMATDPISSTIMIPFQLDDNSPVIQLWSLETGNYIGYKRILLPTTDNNYNESLHIPTSEIELCSTITPAWSFPMNQSTVLTTMMTTESTTSTVPTMYTNQQKQNNNNNNTINEYIPGKFGLWLKLGHLGIYHITATGRCSS